MRKPDSLRAALVAALPGFSTDPDRFLVFVKSGNLAARWTASPAFELRYRLTIGLIDFAGDPNAVFVALIDWLRAQQPDLLTPGRDEDGLVFAADILDAQTADLSIELSLTEALAAVPRDGGGWDLHYVEEPDDALYGIAAAAPLDQVWLDGQRLL